MAVHVAWVKPDIKELIVTGRKTVESRISLRRHPASDTVRGDHLIFKCGDSFALAPVLDVEVYSGLTPDMVAGEVFERWGAAVHGGTADPAYWHTKLHAGHAVFIAFGALGRLVIPASQFKVNATGWIRNWRVPDAYREVVTKAQRRL
jgi:ASC-1-like (ASCH) protein